MLLSHYLTNVETCLTILEQVELMIVLCMLRTILAVLRVCKFVIGLIASNSASSGNFLNLIMLVDLFLFIDTMKLKLKKKCDF